MQDDTNPLVKQVPGQLFSFEEKVFGVMSLTQLLSDIGAGVGILEVTSGLPFVLRLVVAGILALLALLLIHGKAGEQTLVRWLSLYIRALFIAKHTTWQELSEEQPHRAKRTTKHTRGAPIQTTWIALDHLERGIAGYTEPGTKGPAGRYWAILECEGRNIRFLPEDERLKHFRRFETFLCGLEFRLQFLSHVEQVAPSQYPPLRKQREALALLAKTPRLAALQQASIDYQEKHLQHCTLVRHFVVVEATAQEEAARERDGEKQGILAFLFRLVSRPKQVEIPREQVINQLRIRLSVLKQILQQLDVRSHLLDDPDLLREFATSLALGAEIPPFLPQLVEDPDISALHQLTEELNQRTQEGNGVTQGTNPRSLHSNKVRRRTYKKSIKGLHGSFLYQSMSPQARFEAGSIRLADLVAPSQIDISPDIIEVTVRGKKRFQRYFHVVGYGHQLSCGWVSDLTELGLPMVIATSCDPLDSQYLINRLEMQLVRLESRRIADQKAIRIGRASRNIEADQIRAVTHALAARRMKVFAVQMTIGIHAGSRERLEQRTRYLLSHLRQKQLKVRLATRQQEQAWQATLPTCPMTALDTSVNLPSDVLSSFLHLSSGSIGTPTGVFLGFTGTGTSRRAVFYNPWDEEKRVPNPHAVFVGESGMGKSFAGKVFVTGIMGMGIADVVVLDRDDDYLPLHIYLDGESQRYNLARGCPINFFDLPYAPSDVDADDPADLLSEFIDNSLLAGLTLLLCDAETRLSKIEEAYLMHVARLAYAEAGITSEAIRSHPETLLRPMPTLAAFTQMMKQTPASSPSMQASLIERLEKAAYLFSGQTSVAIDKPLTIFSIRELDEKWYAFMTFVIQNFLMRHRALRQDERYLAYVVEEASYMLKHPAGRKSLEIGSRGGRKLGIAQITLSQHPREFLTDGAVIMNNCGAAFFLGMQQYAAQELHLPEELERTITATIPGHIVMRVGNEYAAVSIAASPLHWSLFTTAPQDRKRFRKQTRTYSLASMGQDERRDP
ncbi:hypothetical protein KSF_108080 [Reticulibacter mediterranei]|uniref:Helicase HerA central domain-containing protein n=1 Tax=Reticulibacter mediterranei TaxID=2778369 RepID=A0A8J3IYE0_9CHLR|nr:hypothetical protein [Reticulibacter mediterranei]GHP00761.1 hypothetical protein KSF_108080 [Reticulibacter mediterranei]